MIPKLLQNLHELLVHVIKTTTSSARHFGLAELGEIMSSMAIPLTAFNCQRNISGPLQILPSLSSFAFISETKRSSSELVDLAAAHSDSITSSRRTTLSDSIDMTRVLAAPASNGTITFPFHILILKFYDTNIRITAFC